MDGWALFLLFAVPLLVMAVVIRWRHRRRWTIALGIAGSVVVCAIFGLMYSLTGYLRAASLDAKLLLLATVIVGAIVIGGVWLVAMRGH